MNRNTLRTIDAIINLALGLLLWWYPASLAAWMGLPIAGLNFFPRILGGVLFGIGLALLIQLRSIGQGSIGLGLAGAVAINLSAGITLVVLLLSRPGLTRAGTILLGGLAMVLIGLSGLELCGIWSR